ncbi:MAG: hypothetical protein JKX97_04455 [Candidatus Lindowbacteria bacterium]|nr:hypothetical protein [Candidatus Lindowbacteria bacterium]
MMLLAQIRFKGSSRNTSGASLIGLLIAVFIIMITVSIYLKPTDESGEVKTRPAEAIQTAKKSKSINREKNLELARNMFQATEGRKPKNDQELVDKGYLNVNDLP